MRGRLGMIRAALRRLAGLTVQEATPPPPSVEEQGATSLEYVFIASLISLVVFLVVFQIGDWVLAQFGRMANAL
ncbi:Flp family type IVb pilin [Zavarzinia aquatilis]|uniref:Flp family type IVb pilin n=1 Tax=Zavarzinia aquatilis TaxID=2211142 RepID=A0A317DVD8_9PROT|nr:Flp family type IVb pilin [Zavarzinia aquatilis]PWR18638.1 hypothetical protein DKG74_18625 [Zavarzinia aquatilis]